MPTTRPKRTNASLGSTRPSSPCRPDPAPNLRISPTSGQRIPCSSPPSIFGSRRAPRSCGCTGRGGPRRKPDPIEGFYCEKVSIVKMVSLSEEQQLRARAYPQSARAFGFLGRPCLDPRTRSAPFLRFFASDRLDAGVPQRRRWAYSRIAMLLPLLRTALPRLPSLRAPPVFQPEEAMPSHRPTTPFAASRSAALNSARPRP